VNPKRENSSFRDPSGFLFYEDGILYRQINRCYAGAYSHFLDSGLFTELAENKLLIVHEEVSRPPADPLLGLKVIRPSPLSFVSYPYEWSFGQLKDAALLTLEIARRSLKKNMILKDASAFNVQFEKGAPIWIDTLSFEPYREGSPWIAYGQFCRHFLAPLALMAYRDPGLSKLSLLHLDGLDLALTSRLLPLRSWLRGNLALHLHLHSKQKPPPPQATRQPPPQIGRNAIFGILDGLESAIGGLTLKKENGVWGEYYGDKNFYKENAFEDKKKYVGEFFDRIKPARVLDLGANTGFFSRMAQAGGSFSISIDSDPYCVEANYRQMREKNETHLLPLLADLASPTPAIGWDNHERQSLKNRAGADAVLALALVHHLAIGGNIPLNEIARFFSELAPKCAVEFVPKNDPGAAALLTVRNDIFEEYHREGFEHSFARYFQTDAALPLGHSGRILYFLSRK